MPKRLTAWSLNGGRFVGKSPEEDGEIAKYINSGPVDGPIIYNGPQTLRWLNSLSEPGAELPDVLCLQDFRVSLLRYLRPLPHFFFAPMTNHRIWGKRELTGIAIASRLPLNQITTCYTWGDGIVRDLEGVDDYNHRIKPDDVADELVLKTESRVAIAATVGGFRIATHHGFWVRGGVATDEQMESTSNLCSFLSKETFSNQGLVYVADCNLDKDGKVLAKYLEHGAQDCLPQDIKTTLPDTHPAAKFGAKPDRIMVFPFGSGYAYKVSNVTTSNEPGSDHLLLKAIITKE